MIIKKTRAPVTGLFNKNAVCVDKIGYITIIFVYFCKTSCCSIATVRFTFNDSSQILNGYFVTVMVDDNTIITNIYLTLIVKLKFVKHLNWMIYHNTGHFWPSIDCKVIYQLFGSSNFQLKPTVVIEIISI